MTHASPTTSAQTTASAGEIPPESAAPGRVALVTGGNRGIGRSIAQRLHADGFRVAATHRSGEVPPGVLGVSCDVTDVEQVDAAFSAVEAQLGPVEVVVANAGVTHDTLLLRMRDEEWDSVLQTNLTGSFYLARRATRSMVRARFGRFVFVSSVVGLLGSAGQVNYAASKAGLVGMARSLTRELGPRGITANVVSPGFVDTAMTAELTEAQRADYVGRVPLKRMATPEDVAGVVSFLAGPDGAYVSGAVLPVDGGLGMGH